MFAHSYGSVIKAQHPPHAARWLRALQIRARNMGDTLDTRHSRDTRATHATVHKLIDWAQRARGANIGKKLFAHTPSARPRCKYARALVPSGWKIYMHNFTLITYLAPQSRARFSVERARVCVHDKKRNVFQINDTSRWVRVRASERVDPCARPHHLCCARIGNGYFWRKTTSTVGIIFIDSCILGQRRREGWRVGFWGLAAGRMCAETDTQWSLDGPLESG